MNSLGFPYLVPRASNPGESLQENVPNYRQKIIFSWQKRRFFWADTPLQIYNFILSTPDQERKFYEVIQEGQQKLHFHIDFKEERVSLDIAEYVKNSLISGILFFFQKNIEQKLILDKDILVFTSHGASRFSYHIVVDNFSFLRSIHCKDATLRIMDSLPSETRRFINSQVNKSNQQFRLLGSFNENQPELGVKILQTTWYWYNQEIKWEPRVDILGKAGNYLCFERSLISWFTSRIASNYQITMVCENPYENVGKIDYPTLRSLIPRGWSLSGTRDGNFFNLISDRKHSCLVCNRIHEKENQYLMILSAKQKVLFRCFSAIGGFLLGSSNLESEFILDEDISRRDHPKIKADLIYNKKYVDPISPTMDNVLLLSSYSGSGKTTAFNEYIRKHNPPRVLIISARQQFARSMTAEYNSNKPHLSPFVGEPFRCYLDLEYPEHCDRLVIQVESLYRLEDRDVPFNVIILDEIESIIKQFTSPTIMNHLAQCVEVFYDLVKHTDIVIGGDTFLGDKVIQALNSINVSVEVIRNDYLPISRKAYNHDSWETLSSRALKSLNQGKKIVFFCASAEKVREFVIRCENQKISIKSYTGKSIYDLSDVNSEWINTQCVIYTSVITVGFNFDLPNVFDQLFAYGSTYACSVRDLFQGLLRVRHIKENVLHYAFCDKVPMERLSVEYSDIKIRIENRVNRIHRDTLTFNSELEKVVLSGYRISVLDWMKNYYVRAIMEDNLSRTQYKEVFNDYLTICNYTVYKIPNYMKGNSWYRSSFDDLY